MTSNHADRGTWGSKAGFVLAAAGSAIGLGNIWKFPTEAGLNGGALFVVIYLVCVVLIGVPVMLAELAVGRSTSSDPVGAFKKLAPNSTWKFLGGLGVLTGLVILSAYAVVAGWVLQYCLFMLAGTFRDRSPQEIEAIFGAFVANGPAVVLFQGLLILTTVLIVRGGVQGGIEKATKILMPCLLVLLALLVVRSVTLPGASSGLEFYLRPDFSKINARVVMAALSHAFFSLSLGMGAMITYGSYLSKGDSLPSNALYVCLADSGIAILAGFAIFPALFSVQGLQPNAGPGLIFLVFPTIFNTIPQGSLFGTGFFILIAIAALTSAISLLEVVVAYFIDQRGWTRSQAAIRIGFLAFVIGIPSALSNGAIPALSGFMDLLFKLFAEMSLVIGGLLLCVFVAWKWGIPAALDEIRDGSPFGTAALWSFLVRIVCPIAIFITLGGYIWPLLG